MKVDFSFHEEIVTTGHGQLFHERERGWSALVRVRDRAIGPSGHLHYYLRHPSTESDKSFHDHQTSTFFGSLKSTVTPRYEQNDHSSEQFWFTLCFTHHHFIHVGGTTGPNPKHSNRQPSLLHKFLIYHHLITSSS